MIDRHFSERDFSARITPKCVSFFRGGSHPFRIGFGEWEMEHDVKGGLIGLGGCDLNQTGAEELLAGRSIVIAKRQPKDFPAFSDRRSA